MSSDLILVIVVATALAFDFTNGFHDTANVVATSISTGAAAPKVAIAFAAVLNFVGAFLSIQVAATIANDVVNPEAISSLNIVYAGLIGAISWNLITWYLGLYQIEAPMEQAQRLAHILVQATREIANAMPRLRSFQDLTHFTVEVNRLENDGDRIAREAIASLFNGGIDPMVVIRWKDIFERLEEAIDACEYVANTLAGIVIKNS